MKKMMSILMVSILSMSMLAACGAKPEEAKPAETKPAETTTGSTTTEVAAGGIAKIGLGTITSIGKSKDAEGDKGPLGQVDTIIIAAAFDKDGKVIKVDIDNAQTKVEFDKNLQLATDVNGEFKTKQELGDEYGMKKASTIGKEWYEQANALGQWMQGKTIDEIKAMKTTKRDDAHQAVPDEADLTSSVTITVESYIAAVEKAYNNAIEVQTAGGEKLGVGQSISVKKSKGMEGDKTPTAQVDTTIVVGAFNKDGKVVASIIDTAQTKVDFDKEGKVTTDKNAEIKTKNELGSEYGMIKASSIGKEWNEQAKALADWMVGKNVGEIKGMKTVDAEGHPGIPAETDLTSTVTISAQGFISGMDEAFTKAK
ncbi:hypothetical protein [Brevibacillus daliensis]|uniref:hypothetical protein n=1 Tax=Brevibacillus daliensis TaxID=2892995 RepID=UPI001E5FB74F|nr:hypothetical protein [Brevibacillus daliensis]